MKEHEDCRNVSNKCAWVAFAQQSHSATNWSGIGRYRAETKSFVSREWHRGTVVLRKATARWPGYFRREGGHYALLSHIVINGKFIKCFPAST